jgi:hypothetical protein
VADWWLRAAVHTFTVNAPAQMAQLADVADYIITDVAVASGEFLGPREFFNRRAVDVRLYGGRAEVPADAGAAAFSIGSASGLTLLAKGDGAP